MAIIHPKNIVQRVPPRVLDYGDLERIDPQDSRFRLVRTLTDLRTAPRIKRNERAVIEPKIIEEILFEVDYATRDAEKMRSDFLMYANMHSSLLWPDTLSRFEEERKKYHGRKTKFFGLIFNPEDDYFLSKVHELAGDGLCASTASQAVEFCRKAASNVRFETAVPLLTRNFRKEVLTFCSGENGKWSFQFHPAELSEKFSKDIRVLLVRPA